MAQHELRLAELLAALSVTTDLGMGQAPEKAIRSCLVATGLADRLELPGRQRRDVYYVTLLRHLGCTATASEEARLFGGDELVSRPVAERTDFGRPREMLAMMLATGRGTGSARPRHLARALAGSRHADMIQRSVCEVGASLGRRLGLGDGVREGLYQVMERWDGRGAPAGLAGDQIVIAARIADVATQAVIYHRDAGPAAAVATVAARAGGWFDPEVAAAFERHGEALLREVDAGDPWAAVIDAEPEPVRRITRDDLDTVAAAFADMVDLEAPYLLGHSTQVAELAVAASHVLHLDHATATDLRHAALLHDLGRVAVSSGIWDAPRPLTRQETEQVRLHPYLTERILSHSPVLEPLGRIAGMHHERADGSGYHRGAAAASTPVAARLLAACDAYQAMTQDRPHRPAHPPEQAAALLADEAAAGRLNVECVRAVREVAGQDAGGPAGGGVRAPWPAGLSDREVEVLRLVAGGRSNREIAEALVISRRTAEHHVQHIYTKIGTSTRAAAALFAMEHGLLRD